MPVEHRSLVLLLAAALPLASFAADPPPVPPPALTAADAELLEFLGEFDDAKGEFVDPFVIDAVSTVVDDADREAKRAAKRKAKTDQPKPATPPEKTP